MAESNATQVILTDDGLKIIKAQSTADSAAGGVTNLNDPNLMSVIEKQSNVSQFAGLTSQYNVILQNAKDDGIDTTAVTTAYNNLNKFMADVLSDPNHASDIDRVAYKKYQDAYNEELAKIQSALQNNANNKFTSAASATSQAASTASQAFIQAQSVYDYANSEIAVTSNAIDKAQSAADSASSQAIKAIDTGDVTSQAVTDLKDGSTMTIAELANGLGDKVSNSEYASYKWQTASQIGELVTDGAFSAYKQTTAGLISDKVSTSAFSAYQATTATAIESKVESSDFKSYQKQTADMFVSKVSKKDANNVNLIPYSAMPEADTSQWYEDGTGGTLSITTHAFYHSGADSLYELSTAGSTEVYAKSPRFKIKANTTYTFQLKGFASNNVSSMDVFVLGRPNGNTSDYTVAQQIITGVVLSNSALDYRTVTFTTGAIDEAYIRVDNNGSTNGQMSILCFTELKLEPGDTATEYVYSGQDSMISQLSDDINLRVTKGDLISQINLQAGKTLISSSGQLTLAANTIYFDTDKPVIIPSANIGTLLVNKNLQTADISANTFTTNNGTFTVDKYGAVVASNLTIIGVTNLVYNAALLGNNGSYIPGWIISNNATCWSSVTHDGVPSIGWNNTTGAGIWTNFAQTKLYPLNGATGQPFSASVWFIDWGSDTSLQYQFTLAFFDSNGNRIDGGFVGNTWNGIGSGQGWRCVTINNAVAPSSAVSVGLQYWAYNGKGNAAFSSPMLTQASQATGYQPDTGNVVSAGEIDGSVINGSTINGTTFHGGDIISDSNNTAKYYPMTITPDGAYKSTYFDSMVGLQSSVESGAIAYKYRSMIGNGQYLAYDSVINGQGLDLQSGYTSAKDTTFSNPVSTTTGYVIVNANDGITLHGDNQQITFNGTSADVTPKGVIITPYGNINPNGTQNIWYVGNNMNMKTASFGMDGSGTYGIQFNRSLDIGNFNINTYHTITSSDNGPIHFNRNDGKSVDIYASTVHYDSLVKSSLLSLKKDVQKANTAYWAQLVNSIDLATYQYKSDDNTSHIRLSSIVDDVNDTKQWQLPDVFVSRDENGKLNGVDDSVLLNATLATVQEQQKEIDQLNGHNMELEARLNKLEAKLNG